MLVTTVVTFRNVWPPVKRNRVFNVKRYGCEVDVHANNDGSIEVVCKGAENWKTVTPALTLELDIPYIFTAATSSLDPSKGEVFINRERVDPEKEQNFKPSKIAKRRDPGSTALTDFSKLSETARIRRADVVRNLASYPDKPLKDIEQVRRELLKQSVAILDIAHRVESGSTIHTAGLASSLRMIAAQKSPPAFIQLYAGMMGSRIDVYVAKSAAKSMDTLPGGVVFRAPQISWEPTDQFSNPVDLDIWLEFDTLSIDGTNFISNRQLIEDIANNFGSHYDPRSRPSDSLLSNFVLGEKEDDGKTMITDYTVKIAKCIGNVGKKLASKSHG